MKLSISFNQNSARLLIEGLPDSSLGQSPGIMGIITTWKLQLVGFPLLEGKREHLESLMSAIFQYSRFKVSGINRKSGNSLSPVFILPVNNGHKLTLTSSKKDIKPLSIQLDDAELADLTRCLDKVFYDSRIQIKWNLSQEKVLKKQDFKITSSNIRKIAPALAGAISLLFVGFVFSVTPYSPLPEPKVESIK